MIIGGRKTDERLGGVIREEETTENQSAEIFDIGDEDNKTSLQRDVKE